LKKSAKELEKYLEKLVSEGVAVAFSGGVDSSLVLKLACEAGKKLNKDVYGVTFETKLHPVSDLTISKKVAKEMGAIHKIKQINEFENGAILKNPVDRCYQCKKLLFSQLKEYGKELGCTHILDGTNADDLNTYRPGVRALKELGIISPLAELGITKEEVRAMAKDLNISVSTRPSTPCMATRIPYNTPLDFQLLSNIEKAEGLIKDLGFEIVRVRVHGDIVRIEVPKEDLFRLMEVNDKIISFMKKLGFLYITLDLEGFRSGSMDINLWA
jgi:uncharacterized protein